MSGLNMNANELVKECEKMLNVGGNPLKYIRLAWYSFRGDFNYFKKSILDNVEETEIKKFIDICDNRIERAKLFLQDVGTVIGFFIISLSIVLAVSTMTIGKTPVDPVLSSIVSSKYLYLFPILILSLLAGVIILFILLGHYRTHIHAWTAFKEGAILNKNHAPLSL